MAEEAAAGALAVLASTASMTCTTPLLTRTSVRIILAVTGPEVTYTPVALVVRVMGWPASEVALRPLLMSEE